MSVVVVGANHRTAGLPLLERLAVPADEVPKALDGLLSLDHVVEAVVLSTCNRVEVYALLTRFHPGVQQLHDWFSARAQLAPAALEGSLYTHHDEDAAAHLFAVTAGLDSMIVGERQVAVQVKQAMEAARGQQAARRVLQRLFRQAVGVGRRVRRETAVESGASSMVDVGLQAIAERLPTPLGELRTLIVGAGKLGGLTARRLREGGVGTVSVWNRSYDKARRLAARIDAGVVEGTLTDALATADLVVCTTGAPEPIIDEEMLAGRADPGRPVALLDLGMPRNVAAGCAHLDGVLVVDLARVRELADRGVAREIVEAARAITDEEAAGFGSWTRALEVDPVVRALRERAETVRRDEIERLSARLASLDPSQREVVEALTRGIVNTLLHEPSVRLKTLADHGAAEHAVGALRELFDLEQ